MHESRNDLLHLVPPRLTEGEQARDGVEVHRAAVDAGGRAEEALHTLCYGLRGTDTAQHRDRAQMRYAAPMLQACTTSRHHTIDDHAHVPTLTQLRSRRSSQFAYR
jgi:hypothetical protein